MRAVWDALGAQESDRPGPRLERSPTAVGIATSLLAGASTRAVAADLNAGGVVAPRGGQWSGPLVFATALAAADWPAVRRVRDLLREQRGHRVGSDRGHWRSATAVPPE